MKTIEIYTKALKIIEEKKIITPPVKLRLIELGFKEVIIGTKEIHTINSKEVKVNFHGYDIAIGLSARSISYSSGRQYRAMVFNVQN